MPSLGRLVPSGDLGARQLDDLHDLTSSQIRGLKIAALSVALVSIMSAILTLYWFVRMKRSFRHDLIMLLIQSDMFKALWLTIFPIYEMVNGPIRTESAFCQASGFFLNLGIEASDVAVLLIALHTGFYIFNPGRGLYPYRQYAYTSFVCTPIFLTMLAFINSPAFVNSGEFCYLPTNPGWSRQAISWVPRYVIFGAILLTYGYIYVYVTILMNRFGAAGRRRNDSLTSQGIRKLRRCRTDSEPTVPELAYHGLLPSTPSLDTDPLVQRDRQDSVSSIDTIEMDSRLLARNDSWQRADSNGFNNSVAWNFPNFNPPRVSISSQLEREDVELDPTRTSFSTDNNDPIVAPHPSRARGISVSASSASTLTGSPVIGAQRGFWKRHFIHSAGNRSRASSMPSVFSVLKRGSRTSTNPSSLFLHSGRLDTDDMVNKRAKIRRQLRLLFIYPLVYLAVWLIPFISHLLQEHGNGSPSILVMISLLSLGIQGTANALVFSLREKPWKYSRDLSSNGGSRLWNRHHLQDNTNPNVGRTREQMLVDGKIARRRREQELADRMGQRQGSFGASRQWWDRMQDSVDDLNVLGDLVEEVV